MSNYEETTSDVIVIKKDEQLGTFDQTDEDVIDDKRTWADLFDNLPSPEEERERYYREIDLRNTIRKNFDFIGINAWY